MLRLLTSVDRLVAVKTLQHLGEEAAIDALIVALQDESTAVQKIAITLGHFADTDIVNLLSNT
ncbi:PBS lyase HEAT-like repeat protein [Calothrix sp. NIES-2100]|uniref:HEAT repeat domain-containing protein n=1 Tax=Calothrix sp. NIES-2100 TaxID=1954172 RepID=UPI000B5EE57B|nr:PBS lyase HEAT-like repeat protein [Calothrix sp. NIES-2100]